MSNQENDEVKEQVCGERCKECVYRLFIEDTLILCGYMYYTGKRRQSGVDIECKRFKPLEGNEELRRKLRDNVREK